MSQNYFDEAYFQDGATRGTAYRNYRESARNSRIYPEIAFALNNVFQPKRALEIGCATGILVRYLNEHGCEAHGIDVSEWAVANAEHPNVRLASAAQLPYPDKFFDLVFSCHALEHLPGAVFDASVREICRVGSHHQLHLLPMPGTPPYDGDRDAVIAGLRADPTHQQLHEKQWWVSRFVEQGWTPVPTFIQLRNETSTVELSTGQFVLTRRPVDASVIAERCCAWSQRVGRDLHAHLARLSQAVHVPGVAILEFDARTWKDVESFPTPPLDLRDRFIHLVTIVEGEPARLRLAVGQDTVGAPWHCVSEFHFTAAPGCTSICVTSEQLVRLRGNPDLARIEHLAIGGENQRTRVTVFCADTQGIPLLAQ